jgi:hypothetical protein
MLYHDDKTIRECVPQSDMYVDWLPQTAIQAFGIFELGGPLVDSRTGRVIMMAPLPSRLWTKLVKLPEGVHPDPVPAVGSGNNGDRDFMAAAKTAWQMAAVAS